MAWAEVDTLVAAGDSDEQAVSEARARAAKADAEANRAAAIAETATEKAADLRDQVLDELSGEVVLARAREDDLLSRRKFKSADYDKARADLDIMVRDSKFELMEGQQGEIDRIQGELEALTLQRQAATAYRTKLESILKSIRDAELDINKRIEDREAEVDRLEATLDERDLSYFHNLLPGKKLLTIPILDAFNSPLTIDNLWTENLTMPNGSFGQVRRFDRCTTCHRGIAKTAPGSAVDPAYVPERRIELQLATPGQPPKTTNDEDGSRSLLSVYGFRLANSGLLNSEDVTVDYVAANTLAAKANVVSDTSDGDASPGLQVGDVLLAVNGDKVLGISDAEPAAFQRL